MDGGNVRGGTGPPEFTHWIMPQSAFPWSCLFTLTLGLLSCILYPPYRLSWITPQSPKEFSSVQLLSRVRLCNPMDCSTPGLPVHHPLPEFTQTHVHRVGDAIQLPHPLSSPSSSRLQSFPASGSFPVSQFFPLGVQCIGASASASLLPMSIQLISFRIDWLNLLALHGTLNTLLQQHNSIVSVLWCSAFFMV